MASSLSLFPTELKRRKVYQTAVIFLLLVGCRPAENAPLTVDMPLHLEEHLGVATIVGSEVADDILQLVEWRFDELQPDWKPAEPISPQWEAHQALAQLFTPSEAVPLTPEQLETLRALGYIR